MIEDDASAVLADYVVDRLGDELSLEFLAALAEVDDGRRAHATARLHWSHDRPSGGSSTTFSGCLGSKPPGSGSSDLRR